MLQLLVGTHFDFLGKRKWAYLLSSTIIFVGLLIGIIEGGPNYGIDFTGGTAIRIQFERPIDIGALRQSLGRVGLTESEIKTFEAADEVLIRTQQQESGEAIKARITDLLKKDFATNPFEVRSVEAVGPKIGKELRTAAIWAGVIAMLLILVYVAWRFKGMSYAVGCVIPLFHDVMVTLAFLMMIRAEISLTVVAALLTIVGYSLNDTIVVFDRVRENLKILRRETFERILNISINETLSRTIITNFTVFVVVLLLFFFGGDVIHTFAFAMLVGSISGTYSTIYVASPLVLEWHRRQEMRERQRIGRLRAS